jgi:hypothetical protein
MLPVNGGSSSGCSTSCQRWSRLAGSAVYSWLSATPCCRSEQYSAANAVRSCFVDAAACRSTSLNPYTGSRYGRSPFWQISKLTVFFLLCSGLGARLATVHFGYGGLDFPLGPRWEGLSVAGGAPHSDDRNRQMGHADSQREVLRLREF